MTATETITTNARIQGIDPLLVGEGLGEEDFVTLTLPYIHSAREGVLRVGELLAKYGTYEMNGMAFSDKDEIWYLETIGGLLEEFRMMLTLWPLTALILTNLILSHLILWPRQICRL